MTNLYSKLEGEYETDKREQQWRWGYSFIQYSWSGLKENVTFEKKFNEVRKNIILDRGILDREKL